MSDPKFNWQAFFDTEGESHVNLMTYGGDSTVSVEKLYQYFKERLLSEINFGNVVKKEKP